jgi:hypothetical protein
LSSKDYGRYGANGISVHKSWRDDFLCFLADVGMAPSKHHQIDRRNTLGNYEPGNVRWATRSEQQRNRTTAYVWFIKGKTFQSGIEGAQHYGVRKQTVWKWVNGSFDKRRGTFTPARKDCYVERRY